MAPIFRIVLIVGLLAFTACGGGGGDGSTNTNVTITTDSQTKRSVVIVQQNGQLEIGYEFYQKENQNVCKHQETFYSWSQFCGFIKTDGTCDGEYRQTLRTQYQNVCGH